MVKKILKIIRWWIWVWLLLLPAFLVLEVKQYFFWWWLVLWVGLSRWYHWSPGVSLRVGFWLFVIGVVISVANTDLSEFCIRLALVVIVVGVINEVCQQSRAWRSKWRIAKSA